MMRVIMGEEKKSDLDRVTFTSDTLRKYFPKSYTPQRMQETIIKLLEAWQKKRQRDQEGKPLGMRVKDCGGSECRPCNEDGQRFKICPTRKGSRIPHGA